jgi:hypothetical protein
MEATNSLNIFSPTQTRVAEVVTAPKLNPPSLKEALYIVSPKLLPFALSLSGNMADAEDLCQATILKLIENKDKFLSAEYPLAYAKMVVDKKKPKKAKLNLEFVVDSPKGERIGWFALKDFPSFFSASIVDVKFQNTSGLKNQTYVLEGLKDSTYKAQQICNSGHMLGAASKQVKI